MLKKFAVCYIVATVITIFVMVVETSVRSPILSPFILISDNISSEPHGKILAGYSSIQGDYFLSVHKDTTVNNQLIEPTFQFQLLKNDYSYYSIEKSKTQRLEQDLLTNERYEVITRRGIKLTSEEGANFEPSKSFFINKYFINTNKLGTVQYTPEYSNLIIFITLLLSVLFPPSLFLLYKYLLNSGRGLESIFLIFAPYFLSIIVPLVFNYLFLMNYLLIFTTSYVISIIISILLPMLISSILTIKTGSFYSEAIIKYKKEKDYYFEPNIQNEGIANREVHKFIILLTLLVLYFSLYFLLPLTLQAKIVNNLLFFGIWFISVTILVFFVSFLLHTYTGNYRKLSPQHELNKYIKQIEEETSLKVNVYVKKNSIEDINAWVYSLNIKSNKALNIFVTEGLLEEFSEEEIYSIIYHEIGHIRLKHGQYILLLSLGVSALVSVSLFYLRQIMLSFGWWHYLMVFPIAVIMLILITEWLPKKISKTLEHKADEYAVQKTGNKELYIHTLVKLERLSKTEEDYKVKHREWKASHPTLQKRINYLERNF
ncbi:M48 family metallopeptidase [Bacillus sp. FJAT-45037]|uniref:M48 family metallopeptidase n=1 Tax=Bacillus sp. FJAT-45037 TaxID=2011007 RepID=UPI000C23F42F|nr:M48 family metallopeptidase [Bacillus sp. FJAT-45037]